MKQVGMTFKSGYKTDISAERRRSREARKSAKKRLCRRVWLTDLKSKLKCEHCGENTPICLDFHHIDPEKKSKSVAVLMCSGVKKGRILAEIKKCIVLCANCHRKLHYGKQTDF